MAIPPSLEAWLLEGKEPSLRRRILVELQGRGPEDPEVVAATAEMERTGWGHEILARQLPSGQWDAPGTSGHDLYTPKYIATNWRLIVLADLGFTRAQPGVARAAELLLAAHTGADGDLGGSGSEVCFTGNAVRTLTRLGYGDDARVHASVDWLLRAQKGDGGWHCFPSEAGTLDGWEALAAFAVMPRSGWTDGIRRSVEAGATFYLDRSLLVEGEAYPPWTRTHYPTHYHYDFLVGLDMLTALGYGKDRRMAPALDLLESKRNPDGSWNLDAVQPDIPASEEYQLRTPYYPFVLEPPGRPSRWITITALRVLGQAGPG